MRRLLATIATGSILWAVTVGSAASLDVSRSTLAAGKAPVSACDRDRVDVDVSLGWRDHVGVERVTVRGIDDRCVGLSLHLVLIVAGDAVELEPATIPGTSTDDNWVELTVPVDVRAADLERIHIVIS